MIYQTVERRKALKYFGILAASAAGQEFLASWLSGAGRTGAGHQNNSVSGAEPSIANSAAPQFFSPTEYQTVEILTELIIPTDDQPGAKEAQVASYIDFVVFSAAEFQPQMQREWIEGLATLEKLSQQRHGRAFQGLSTEKQVALLNEMSLPERDSSAIHEGFAFYRRVKEMTVEGFYTSKIGLVDVLGFQGRAFLTEFQGCTHPEHQS
jgi:gluconate 2-dehydrogenase gamma chain